LAVRDPREPQAKRLPTVTSLRPRPSVPWILLLAAGCTSYVPAAELWPTFDASFGAGPAVPAGSGGSDLGTAGGGGRGGAPIGAAGAGGSSSTAGGGAGGSDSTGAGGLSGGSGAGGVADAGNAGGRGGASGFGGGQGTDAGSCSLSVTVTTVTNNGQYSPRNIGAIWISKNNDMFVKTLAIWARSRISRLTLWNSVTSSAGQNGNTVDAITGATLSSHQTHRASWNCTNTSRVVVPDGSYRVHFEMTDKNSAGPQTSIDFTKGPMPFSVTPPDQPNFKGINLVFAP
jgi:hypothetical protein